MSDSLQKNGNNELPDRRRKFEFIPHYTVEDNQPAGSSLDPQKIISVLLRYKWLVMLFLIVSLTAAWFYADSITPTYESRGTLLISSSDASTNDELSQIISQTTGYGTSSTFENELQVLRSRKFSHLVAQKLIQEDPQSINKFPILWTVTEEGEVYKSDEETVASRIRSNFGLRQPQEESNVVEISFTSQSPQEAAKVVNLAMEIYVENSTRQNRQAAESTTKFLEKEKQEIRQKLEASEERLRQFMDSTGIVQVDEQATRIVNQQANTEAELQNLNLELEAIEEAISNYESRLEKIKPGLSQQFSDAIGPRIQNSQQELAAFERERTLIITKNPGVLERVPLPPRLKYINEQIASLKQSIKDLSDQLFTVDDEFMGLGGEERAQMVSNIQSSLVELQISRNQNLSRREVLRQHQAEVASSFNSLPEEMIELSKLQRDVRLNEELYLNVSRQYADMSVLKQSQFGFGRIIDSAEIPGVPVSPNKKMFLILGLMLGGLLSTGFIVTREFMDNSVKSVDQLRKNILSEFVLSVVPTFDKIPDRDRKMFTVGEGKIPAEMVILQDRLSLASESIRRLKNNIIFQHGEVPPKTMAVTSPEKGDGKSTIVANLAISFAEEGYKTLVIDADFRRPKLQEWFGLTSKKGLADYIDGNIPFNQLIQDSEFSNLKVITAGNDIQRPEIIGNSMSFKQLLKRMEDSFEVIILDTAPFGIISDSSAILQRVESTIVVARHRTTNQNMLFRTIEQLKRIHANITDIVLNDFDYRKEDSSYYGNGYYRTLYANYEIYTK